MRSAFTIVYLFITLSAVITWAKEATPQPSWWHQASRDAQKDGYRLIKPNDLQVLLRGSDDFLLLDVRPGYEYRQGHLPNATHMEFDLGDRLALTKIKKSALINMLGSDKNRLIVIYCRSFR